GAVDGGTDRATCGVGAALSDLGSIATVTETDASDKIGTETVINAAAHPHECIAQLEVAALIGPKIDEAASPEGGVAERDGFGPGRSGLCRAGRSQSHGGADRFTGDGVTGVFAHRQAGARLFIGAESSVLADLPRQAEADVERVGL